LAVYDRQHPYAVRVHPGNILPDNSLHLTHGHPCHHVAQVPLSGAISLVLQQRFHRYALLRGFVRVCGDTLVRRSLPITLLCCQNGSGRCRRRQRDYFFAEQKQGQVNALLLPLKHFP